jgi:hypothetical protein
MKLPIFILVFVLVSTGILAQEKKSSTVRIRKVEVINGVEKISDTTYTSDQTPELPELDIISNTMGGLPGEKQAREMKVIQFFDPAHPDAINNMSISIQGNMSEEEAKKFHELRAKQIELTQSSGKMTIPSNMTKSVHITDNGDTIVYLKEDLDLSIDAKDGQMMVIKKAPCGSSQEVIMNAPVEAIITICNKVVIKDLDVSDQQKLKAKSNHLSGTELRTDDLKFSPNPNNGKFNLSFNLKSHEDVQVSIFDLEGKSIYEETLKNFSGKYSRDMDLSAQPKGVYYVKIAQSGNVSMKKLVIE